MLCSVERQVTALLQACRSLLCCLEWSKVEGVHQVAGSLDHLII
jgi:hypothetical protein